MGNSLKIYIASDNIISSLGFTTQENMLALHSYRSGILVNDDSQIVDRKICVGAIDKVQLTSLVAQNKLEDYTRMEQLFILSIKEMLSHTALQTGDIDCGLVISTTKGSIDLLHKHTEEVDQRVYLWSLAERIASYFGLDNRVTIVSNACISGVSALIVAKRFIEQGKYKRVIVAGGDILSHFVTSGFLSFRSVSKKMCCPYDSHRNGLNLGEACGSILLTKDFQENSVLLTGGGISNDANHISGPSRTGDGLYYAIRQSMVEANVLPSDISFVNAHGTATVYNDEMESKAIHLAELQQSPINSLKSYFGHTLGASGVIESIICIHELKEGVIFGTLGFHELGVSMPILVQAEHQKIVMKSCIKTASGFGGCNAAIVLSLPNFAKRPLASEVSLFKKRETVIISNGQLTKNGEVLFNSVNKDFVPFIKELFKSLGEINTKFHKMDDLCKLGYVAATYLLKDKPVYQSTEIGIILSNSSSSLYSDIKHQRILDKEGDAGASPAVFVYTLPNLVLGELCIRHKMQGENTFFISKEYNSTEINEYAQIAIQKGNLKACIIGWCELLENQYKVEFTLIEKE